MSSDAALQGPARTGAVVLFVLLGAMSAVLEILLVPVYVGGVIFPITLVLAIGGNIFLARGLRSLTGSTGLASLPLIVWVLVIFFMGFVADAMGDVLLPGYGQGQYVALALPLVGILAGVMSIFLEPRPEPRSEPRSEPRPVSSRPRPGNRTRSR
jgi:hypothetical protein